MVEVQYVDLVHDLVVNRPSEIVFCAVPSCYIRFNRRAPSTRKYCYRHERFNEYPPGVEFQAFLAKQISDKSLAGEKGTFNGGR